MQPHRTGLGLLVISLVVGACTGVPADTSTMPTAGPTTAPTATPAPTSPPDVSSTFSKAFAAVHSGIIRMTATITVGSVESNLQVTNEFDRGDSKTTTIASVGSTETTTETVTVAGKHYTRTNVGPWLETAATPDSGFGAAIGRLADNVSDSGVVDRDGRALHKLVPTTSEPLSPKLLGVDAGDAAVVTSEAVFYADAVGAPVAADISLSWTGGAGRLTTGSIVLSLDFDRLGDPMRISPPPDVWNTLVSSRFDYAVNYPHEWDYFKGAAFDEFDSPVGVRVVVVREKNVGLTLNQFSSAWITYAKKEYKPAGTASEPATVDGLKARFVTLDKATLKGCACGKLVIFNALVVKEKSVYVISWLGPAGTEDKDEVVFKAVLAQLHFS
jgi:hypothetical protein